MGPRAPRSAQVSERKQKLIDPKLQKRFALLFLSTAAAAVLLQVTVLYFVLDRVAASMPSAGEQLAGRIPHIVAASGLITFALLVPVTLGLGIRSMFRIVGPVYRFREFLTEVAAGNRTEGCQIRAGDEFQDVCELLNEVTEPLRESARPRAKPGAILKFPGPTHDFAAR